ncbi:MAG TPA: orotate phosphoribosyltransferase [Actinomycetota bacterium]|jgi:orotate phosphoribosyltransferase|nr:orotate phosphoribosyltransferase [Actinomycetota bacterium]
MNEAEVGELLEEHGALQRGHFKLSSGRHSDVFVQTALVLCYPGIAERLGHELGERFAGADVSVVLSPAVAGLVIGHEVARHLNVRHVFCERADGRMRLRRGFSIGGDENVLVVDNAMTDGASKQEVIDLVKEIGADVAGVAIIADRSKDVSFGVPLQSLVRIETTEWDAGDCPLCREGLPIDAPGSRHLAR